MPKRFRYGLGGATAPGSLDKQEPEPGRLLIAGPDGAIVMPASVQHLGQPAGATGIVAFVRGDKYGKRRAYADCTGALLAISGESSGEWRTGGRTITDLIGEATCYGHPLLREPGPGAAT